MGLLRSVEKEKMLLWLCDLLQMLQLHPVQLTPDTTGNVAMFRTKVTIPVNHEFKFISVCLSQSGKSDRETEKPINGKYEKNSESRKGSIDIWIGFQFLFLVISVEVIIRLPSALGMC